MIEYAGIIKDSPFLANQLLINENNLLHEYKITLTEKGIETYEYLIEKNGW